MRKNVLTKDVLISKEIEYMIDSGDLAEGSRIPSERQLAESFDVQRGTIRSALRILAEKGIVESRPRSGYYVAPARVVFDQDDYNSRKVVIENMGKTTYVKLLTFEKTFVSEKMAVKTGLPEDMQVYRIMRLRFAEGQPLGLERTHIRCDLVPELTEEDVHNKSIYETLKKRYGIHVTRAVAKVTAVFANGLESELLNTDMNKPVMRYEGLVYDRRGRLVEYYDDIILKEKVEFLNFDIK